MSMVKENARVLSLDQFRGYSVAAMLVINFVGGLTITHQLFKHNNTHFSYADSIMPSFMLACGYSFRLSYLKRIARESLGKVRISFLRRGGLLILISVLFFGFGVDFQSADEVTLTSLKEFWCQLWKANLWEVLAIIGAAQILVLPFIQLTSWQRAAVLAGFAILHILLSWSFNYDFVYGNTNWMDHVFGAAGKRCWDGGFFGTISWAEIVLAGTIVCDAVAGQEPRRAAGKLLLLSLPLMLSGYLMSCLTTLYDVVPSDSVNSVKEIGVLDQAEIAQSPVLPDFQRAAGRAWWQLLAEPPFVVPPGSDKRQSNYWMMDKRIVTQSFVVFSTGFAVMLLACFVVACDAYGYKSLLFEVLGSNPLVAFLVHHMIEHNIRALVPKDSGLVWVLIWLCISFGLTYYMVRFLNDRKLILRL
ncbi:MAG: DUF1624 domain-containing protein [Planctomycetales bacterium]|nr:DUF1624 domain-containing protein [Planctomycetales bacterium]